MLRLLTLGAALALLAVGAASAGGAAVAFVTLPERDQVVAVDVGSGDVLRRIRVGGRPQEVTAYHDWSRRRDFVLVTSRRTGTVTLIDAFSRQVVRVWKGFGAPADVVVDALRAYVTDNARGRLVVIDLRSRRVLARIAVGPRPRALAVGDLAIVAHDGRASLTLVDVRRWRIVDSLPVGGVVQSVSKQPDTATVYVTFRGSGNVALVDWGRRRVVFRRTVARSTSEVVKDVYIGSRLGHRSCGRQGAPRLRSGRAGPPGPPRLRGDRAPLARPDRSGRDPGDVPGNQVARRLGHPLVGPAVDPARRCPRRSRRRGLAVVSARVLA